MSTSDARSILIPGKVKSSKAIMSLIFVVEAALALELAIGWGG